MIKSYIFLIAIFYVFPLFIKVVNCDIHIIDNTKCNNNKKETIYLGTNYANEGRKKKEIYEKLNTSSLGDIHDQEERKLNYTKNRKYSDITNFDNTKNSSSYYILLRKKTFIPFYLLLQEKINMFDISKKAKDNLSVKQKKHAHLITNNNKEKEMINTSLLYKRSMYNQCYSQSHNHKLFPINVDVNSKKDDFGIYKMNKDTFSKTQKKYMFLELDYKHSNGLMHADAKNEDISKLIDNDKPLGDVHDIEIFKNFGLSCKEFSCPNSYQMCISEIYDEKKFFNGEHLADIINRMLNKNANSYDGDFDYTKTYKCVCKKYLTDNLCDESVE